MKPPSMPAKSKEPDPRIIIPIPPKLLQQIDDYRWQNRIHSRAEAIRLLVKEGLKAKK
jgi:metal-responsive CopG/Arc/MetJ family transcriptional regulator